MRTTVGILLGVFAPMCAALGAPCVIAGRVVNEEKAGVAQARLRVEPGSMTALSGADGRFEVGCGESGKVTLSVIAKGYFSGAKVELDVASQPASEVEVTLKRESVLEQSVVVTGSGSQDLLVEAPVRTELISRTYAQEQVARNLSETLVASVPGVRLENNCQNCGWSAIRMNGMEGPYTQVLEDGLPTVSGASMVYALDQLPVEFFENVEVVKGGASALYGPNAVAGVINMVRREPQHNHFQVDGSFGLFKGRPEQTGGLVGQLKDFWNQWSADFYYRGYRRSHADIDRDGFTELTRRRSNGAGVTLFRQFMEGSARLTTGASGIRDFRRGGDQLDVAPEYSNITEQIHSTRTAAFARWSHSVTPTLYYNLSSSLSLLNRASYYGAGMDPNAYGRTNNPLSTSDASAGLQLGRHTLSVGTQYWYERVADIYAGYNRATRLTSHLAGAYVQDEFRVSPRLVLLAGARIDKSNLLDHAVVSPRGNLRIGLTEKLNLRVGVSTGFRPPQVFDEDLHVAAVGGEAMLVRQALGLNEEKSRSLTSALDYVGRLGGGVFQAGASFFWTRLDDVFQLHEVGLSDTGDRLFERGNGPGSRFRGFEFSSSWKPSRRLALRAGGTFQQSRYDAPEPVFGSLRYFRSPNRYGYAGADFELPWGISWLNTFDFTGAMLVPHYAGMIASDRLETSPFFKVWSVVLSKTFVLDGDHTRLRTYLRANNLGDSFQRDFDRGPMRDSTYMYGPLTPRSAVAGVSLEF